jgi:hypothetical protein
MATSPLKETLVLPNVTQGLGLGRITSLNFKEIGCGCVDWFEMVRDRV